MVKILILFVFIFFLSLVSAYENCVDISSTEQWCCTNSDYGICNPNGNVNNFICGTSSYCDIWESDDGKSGKSCIPGEDWCCYDVGHIVDYSAHWCCVPEYPFRHSDGYCRNWPEAQTIAAQDSVSGLWVARVNSFISDNYYTKRSNCYNSGGYLINKCEGYNSWKCTIQEEYIHNWVNQGVIIGQCGVECVEGQEKCKILISIPEVTPPKDYNNYVCEGNQWVNKGPTIGRCDVECAVNLDCGGTCENYTCVGGGTTKNYYRYANENCTEIELLPSQVTTNDYLYKSDCVARIKVEPVWYRQVLYTYQGYDLELWHVGVVILGFIFITGGKGKYGKR